MSFINKPGKTTSRRNHLANNLVADVILKEKIETGLPMAKTLTKLLAKLITFSKRGDLHARRLALRHLVNKKDTGVVDKLFVDLRQRYQDRQGGYSRIVKKGYRVGDNSLRVIFSLV